MMKKILAAAIVSAFAAPAFAATANVDIYGKLHVSVSMFDDQDETYNSLQISSNASRIGFKGTEDLGGGLSAIWQIESGLNLDEQGGTWASRNSFVGLKGGFGTVLMGNHDTPLKMVGRTVDLFGDTMADSRNVMGILSDARADNAIMYMSPKFGGLSFSGLYTTDGITSGSTNGDLEDKSLWSLNATYNNGPLFLGAGYSDGKVFDDISLGVDLNGDGVVNAADLVEIKKEYTLAAGFTMGNFKMVGQYVANDNSIADYDAWMLGGAFNMGNVVLKANYMEGEYDNVDLDIKQWTVGADYNLSKRTSVYALYANGENIVLGAGGGSSDRLAPEDDDISVISVGVVHTF